MKRLLYTLLSLILVTFVGCKKDSETGSITIDNAGLYVENFGESISTTFTSSNVSKVYVQYAPEGWQIDVSMETRTITATAPSKTNSSAELIGGVILAGTVADNNTVFELFDVGKVDFIELDDIQANSMILAQPGVFCTFNPNRRGESTDEVATKASDCELLWATSDFPIKHIQMKGDRIGFFVNIDTEDIDDDYNKADLIPGNAVVSALSASGTTLWSWHIWVTERAISEVDINGVTFMDRNLGAQINSNVDSDTTAETDYTDSIMASYGLYYQWGRKDPFIYPYTYDMGGNYNGLTYNADGSYLYFLFDPSSANTGTISYSTLNPRVFLAGDDASNYDWLYGTSESSLWDNNGTKSIYDPSPKGWRVPSAADLAAIGDPTPGEVTVESYGAELGGELFMALGRRIYLDGALQNFAPGDRYQPWSGYYWSRETTTDNENGAHQATALHFYRDQDSAEVIVNRAAPLYRSTGAQIRCVKM